MMKIVVIGGTGLIGSKLVEKLRADGHDPVAAAPNTGVDTITGKGLAEALEGAQVVVEHVPGRGQEEVHHRRVTPVRRVGYVDSGYFRAKLAQEEALTAGAIPCTILRATQFFEFIPRIADSGAADGTVTLPPVLFQPEAADDVAAALADIPASRPGSASPRVTPADTVPTAQEAGLAVSLTASPAPLPGHTLNWHREHR